MRTRALAVLATFALAGCFAPGRDDQRGPYVFVERHGRVVVVQDMHGDRYLVGNDGTLVPFAALVEAAKAKP